MQEAIVAFFDANEAWLERVLERGRDEGTLDFRGAAIDAARTIVSGLQGAMLVTRPHPELDRFQTTARQLLANITLPAS
jgi:TetR/AcrR family transcriptional repressor of nem operon